MAAYNKFNAFVEAVGKKVHNLAADQLKVALTAVAPTATMAVLADLTEISYDNLSSRNITTTSYAQTAGTAKLILADLTLTASDGSIAAFRYIAIYNDSATNKELIAWFDYGSNITVPNGGTFTLDFDNVNGAAQLG